MSRVARDVQQPEPCNFVAPIELDGDPPQSPVRAQFVVAFVTAIVAFLCIMALATGCAVTSPQGPTLRQWAHDSAVIVVDASAPACGFWAVQEALDVLRPRIDVSIRRDAVREPLPGEIVVEWARPADALGKAWVWPAGDEITRCRVQVDACHPRLLAHELGHCWGLANVDIAGRLMAAGYGNGWYTLSKDEIDALRRR
jgi:hypothetical protein